MRTIDIIYRKIKDRWNHQRALMNASREELEFLVNLLDIIEADDDETDTNVLNNDWISVKDKLPEKSQLVLVSLVNEIDGHRMKTPQIGYHTGDEGRMWFIYSWNEWATASDFMVTHWMPTPEAPKEGEME